MGHQLLGRRHFPKEPSADGVEPPNDESGVIHRSNALGLHGTSFWARGARVKSATCVAAGLADWWWRTTIEPNTADSWPRRSSVMAFVDGPGEDDHADQPDRARRPEWQRRSQLSEQTTDEGGRRDGKTPDQIVERDGPRPEGRCREID